MARVTTNRERKSTSMRDLVETAKEIRRQGMRDEWMTPERRHQMIAEAAYYIAQRRHFEGGWQESDWFEAEHQIDEMLATYQA